MEPTVKVHWYCGYYVGPMKWQSLDIYEPDECGMEFDTLVGESEWDEGEAKATCPKCGAILNQSDDLPSLATD